MLICDKGHFIKNYRDTKPNNRGLVVVCSFEEAVNGEIAPEIGGVPTGFAKSEFDQRGRNLVKVLAECSAKSERCIAFRIG